MTAWVAPRCKWEALPWFTSCHYWRGSVAAEIVLLALSAVYVMLSPEGPLHKSQGQLYVTCSFCSTPLCLPTLTASPARTFARLASSDAWCALIRQLSPSTNSTRMLGHNASSDHSPGSAFSRSLQLYRRSSCRVQVKAREGFGRVEA